MNKPDADVISDFNQLREWRLDGVYKDIQEWGGRPITFTSDPRGTQLYSIEEMKRALCRRFIDLSDTAKLLVGEGKVIGAAILARSQIETVAMATYFVHEVSRMIGRRDLARFDEQVARFLGREGPDGNIAKRIHVMDALRHLEDLDTSYIEHLWAKYPAFITTFKLLKVSSSNDIAVEEVVSKISVMKNYDLLSEFAHPNAFGTFFIYGQPEDAGEAEQRSKQRLTYLARAATWQGHHMLNALRASEGQPEEYFCQFGNPDSK